MWPFLLEYPQEKIAIINDICVVHPKKELQPGSKLTIYKEHNPHAEHVAVLAKFGYEGEVSTLYPSLHAFTCLYMPYMSLYAFTCLLTCLCAVHPAAATIALQYSPHVKDCLSMSRPCACKIGFWWVGFDACLGHVEVRRQRLHCAADLEEEV